jgi:NAD(P)-dependent dehydrogenase (short-subunit alcohol dehydrogenase family)
VADRFSGKVAAITGASRGLGAAFARRLAAEGASIALLARPSADLERTGDEIAGALKAPCDVGDPDSVRAAFAAVSARFGRLDILVNNAALNLPNLIEQASDDDIRGEVTTNLIGPIFCTRSAVPLMKANGSGDIVYVSSIVSQRVFPYLSVYGATKAGLECLAEHHREELRADNIRSIVLRLGNFKGGNVSANWAPGRAESYMAVLRDAGVLDYVGAAMEPDVVAGALADALATPRGATVNILEVRGS